MKRSPRVSRPLPARCLRSIAFAASVACLFAHSARAVIYTDAGGTSLFSTAFNPAIPAGGTTFADTLLFNNTSASNQTDDLTQALNANVLTFSNTGSLTLNPGAGTTITLGGTAPQINLLNSGTLVMGLNLALQANLTFAGTSSVGNAAGSTTFSGAISGNFGITKSGTYNYYNSLFATGGANIDPGGGGATNTAYGGLLVLSGNNTYTGATTVSVGTLQVNGTAGQLSGTSGLTVNGNATFINGDTVAANAANNNNFVNRINPAATLTLGGTNGGGTFTSAFGTTAATTSPGQTFAGLAIGQGNNAINTGGTAAGSLSLTFTGTSAGAGYTRSTGGVVDVATATGFTASFTNAPTAAGGSSVAGTSAPILIGATLGGNDFIAAKAGTFAAPTYTSAGTTSLTSDANINVTGANTTLAAGSTVSVNSLRFPDTTARTLALGSGSTLTVASGGILTPSSVASSGTTISGGTITSGTGDLWISANSTGNLDPRSTPKFSLIISSVIADRGSNPVAVTVTGGQLVSLNGTNTYTGGTFLNNGYVGVKADSGFGATTGAVTAVSGFNTIDPSASFTFNASRSFVINAGATLSIADQGVSTTIAGTVSGGGLLAVGYVSGGQKLILTGNNSNFTGVYQVNGSLRADEGVGLSSNANLLFNGRNTYGLGILETSASTFTRSVGAGPGQVQWEAAGSNQYNEGGFAAVGGTGPLTVNLGGNGAQLTFGTGGFVGNGNGILHLQDPSATQPLFFANDLALNGAARSVVSGSTTQLATLSGVISGTAASGLNLNYSGGGSGNGSGLIALTGASTYLGTTKILSGSVAVSSINSVATSATLGTVHSASSNLGAPTTVATGTIGLGSLDTNGTLQYIGTGETTDRVINLAGVTGGGTITQAGTGALVFTSNLTATGAGIKTLTLNGSTAGTGTLSGAIVDNSATNTTAVTKSGTGVWTLGGANTYTGTTTVSAGALVINATSGGTGAINVTGGTLLGNGTAPTGLLTVSSGANLAPGGTANGTTSPTTAASAGKLNVGALTLSSGANFNILLSENNSTTGAGAGSLYSQLAANGTINLAGNLNLVLSGQLTVGDKFFILTNAASGANGGSFANINGTSFTAGGDTFTINYADTFDATAGNDISLTVTGVTAVPEPSTWIAGLLCAGALAYRSVRRRSTASRRRDVAGL